MESTPEGRSAYAEGETLAERLVTEEIARTSSAWMILRPSQIFGADSDVIGGLGIPVGRNVIVLGGPRKQMRLVHVDDVARGIVDFMAPRRFSPGVVLDLTHTDTLLARDVARLLKQRRGLRVCFLRPWLGKGLALGTRLTNRVLGRGSKLSARQAAYLFSECGAGAKAAVQLGWKASNTLQAQVEALLI